MTAKAIASLTPGTKYRVQVRTFDIFTQRHVTGRRVVRMFFETERRFNSISCAVFSSAISKGRVPKGEWSVPHYDILECTPV